MPRSFDRIKPGLVIDRQTAATLNRALELLEALSLPRSTGEIGLYSRPGGIAVSDQRPFPETWWVSIDGPGVTSQRYEDWTRLEDQGDGTFAAADDDAAGGPTFPGFLPPGWSIPAAGSVAMGIPASDGESLLLLTPAASAGTALHPTSVSYGPYYTEVWTGPSIGITVSGGSVLVIGGGGIVEFDAAVCFDHYPLWDVFRDTLHASPVADYAGDDRPWWLLDFDGSDPEWELSGIVAPPETCEGAEHVLTNTAAVPLVLLPDDAGSVAANRIETPDGLPFTVGLDESAWLRYDRILFRWRLICWTPREADYDLSGIVSRAAQWMGAGAKYFTDKVGIGSGDGTHGLASVMANSALDVRGYGWVYFAQAISFGGGNLATAETDGVQLSWDALHTVNLSPPSGLSGAFRLNIAGAGAVLSINGVDGVTLTL